MIMAVNTALYLRRPLLLTGKPGTGKSTLISKVAYELKLGPVLRWPITSRSTVRGGVYNYDAVARLQSGDKHAPVSDYLTLGPLGTALASTTWPRALLIDEIDKSDLDFANDLLNVIEEGVYEIPELSRLKDAEAPVKDAEGKVVNVRHGLLQCGQFPFVVMTSNAEREFPPPFLRRCVRLDIEKPKEKSEVEAIVKSHLKTYSTRTGQDTELETMIGRFLQAGDSNQEIATDQLLNAVFLTIGLNDPERRTFDPKELEQLRDTLLRPLGS
jgi:MoxR-like ATPase